MSNLNLNQQDDLFFLQVRLFRLAQIKWSVDSNRDWLHCVAEHRKRDLFNNDQKDWNKFDIIAGKIANDTTNQVLTTYINGLYGEVDSDLADETAIRLLLSNKLSNQICFKSEKSLQKLLFLEAKDKLNFWWNRPNYLADEYEREISSNMA